MKRLFLSVIGLILSILMASANAEVVSRDSARSLYDGGDFAAAIEAYAGIAEWDSLTQREWFAYGTALLESGRLDEAIRAYDHVDENGSYRINVEYNLACAYALQEKVDESLNHLEKAVAAGFSNDEGMMADEDLEPLHGNERFEELVLRAARNARPCEFGEEYAQLDFWVGDWEVYTESGQLAGYNTITKDIDNCVLFENWRSARQGGMTGKSMNYYNPALKQWIQQWIGSDGGVIRMSADFDGSSMIYSGKHMEVTGETKLMRMMLTPLENGDVRQFIEESGDGGKTWYEWFTGVYKLKK
ncbi:MAG: tetratricopeptide repeat protein [Candidatus Zixiibacteriota bacterium]